MLGSISQTRHRMRNISQTWDETITQAQVTETLTKGQRKMKFFWTGAFFLKGQASSP